MYVQIALCYSQQLLKKETRVVVYNRFLVWKVKMGKEKKEKRKSENLDDTQNSQDSKEVWEEKLKNLNAIAKPLASRKLTKKICKAIKKGMLNSHFDLNERQRDM